MLKESLMILEDWYNLNKSDPYPTLLKKSSLAKETNLTIRQVSYWFIKRRNNKITEDNPNRLSVKQKDMLKNYYWHFKKQPSISELRKLSEAACITEKRAAKWFSSERHREKKTIKKKSTETTMS
jgi:hypothetical protein